jgi:hypothetical protein
LASSLTSFWFTARLYFSSVNNTATSCDLLSFLDGGVRRLVICNVNASSAQIRLVKQDNAGTKTTLVTSSLLISSGALYKVDVQVINYGVSGTVNVYFDGVLWLTYTGDLTTNGSSSLSGFAMGSYSNITTPAFWSEVITASVDTRALSVVTLPPLANGNAFNWTTGTTTDLSEVTLNDATLATSATAGQVAQSTVTSTGITGNPIIQAVVVSARVQKGSSGPTKADLGVRTAATDYWSADIVLPAALDRISNVWEMNPNTSAPWTYTDLTAAGFNVGVKSVT